MYTECPLYGMQSKKQLYKFLSINDEELKKGVCNKYQKVEIAQDGRLLEKSSGELKDVQKRINGCLKKCEYPSYLHSGLKGKSYYTNAKVHQNCKYMFKVDISAFFPNTKREKVYDFFLHELAVSPDVAKLLTDYTTIDIGVNLDNDERLKELVVSKNIRFDNHLITGAPTSILLSFLCNRRMFDTLDKISEKNNCTFSVYVDDIFFSSLTAIPSHVKKRIITELNSNGYNVSDKKVKYYRSDDYKVVTGVAISPNNELKITNRLRYKILNATIDNSNKLSTIGMIKSARWIESCAYGNLLRFINDSGAD